MPERSCPDCRTGLSPIRLLDYVGRPLGFGLHYAAADAKPSIWNGQYPLAGVIQGFLCPECGRVLLYAETERDRLPLPSQPSSEDPASLPRPAADPDTEV